MYEFFRCTEKTCIFLSSNVFFRTWRQLLMTKGYCEERVYPARKYLNTVFRVGPKSDLACYKQT